mmetsp:Transcript_25814/g.103124  ORF Transcript_25814/g.103124 Transcript_25814/m.103124 type:complete len:289 (-) Transcript_25814:34-900(-)
MAAAASRALASQSPPNLAWRSASSTSAEGKSTSRRLREELATSPPSAACRSGRVPCLAAAAAARNLAREAETLLSEARGGAKDAALSARHSGSAACFLEEEEEEELPLCDALRSRAAGGRRETHETSAGVPSARDRAAAADTLGTTKRRAPAAYATRHSSSVRGATKATRGQRSSAMRAERSKAESASASATPSGPRSTSLAVSSSLDEEGASRLANRAGVRGRALSAATRGLLLLDQVPRASPESNWRPAAIDLVVPAGTTLVGASAGVPRLCNSPRSTARTAAIMP